MLILENGVDVKGIDFKGNTALYEAVKFGYAEVVRLLLRNGADPKAENIEGRTPSLEVKASASSLILCEFQLIRFKTVREIVGRRR
jgi:ankyrin repeat protein